MLIAPASYKQRHPLSHRENRMRRPSTFNTPNSKKIKLNHYLSHSKDPLVDQDELTRLLTMQLYNMGFTKAAHQLEAESNVQMENKDISLLRSAILKGEWSSVYGILTILDLPNDNSVRQVCYKQELLEMIMLGRRIDALQLLRTLSPILSQDKIYSFSKLVMSSEDDIFNKYQDIQNRRQHVLMKLENLFPKSMMIPHRRLEELILQSFEFQKQQCLYHNNNEDHTLFVDHQCSSDLFPRHIKCEISAHSSEIWALTWNPSGTLLASGGKDAIVKLWDITGNCVAQLQAHSSSITKIKFSPDGRFLLTGSSDSCIKLWELATYSCKTSLEVHKGDITGLEWTSDSSFFITSSTNSPLVLWDLRGHIKHKWSIPRITSIAMDPSGMYLCAVSGEKTIHVLNVISKLQVRLFKESDAIVDICASNHHTELMITYHTNEIKVKHMLTGKINGKYSGHVTLNFI